MTAIRAEYVHVKPVPSRKVVQLIFEVPLEAADNAHAVLGGYPNPAESRYVAIARLKEGAEEKSTKQAPAREATLVQQAAIISEKVEWDAYVAAAHPDKPERGAEAMRLLCGVKSRSEIKPGTVAGDKFMQIRDYFNTYLRYGMV